MKTAQTTRSGSPGPKTDPLQMTIISLVTSHIAPSRWAPGCYDYPFDLDSIPDPRWANGFFETAVPSESEEVV